MNEYQTLKKKTTKLIVMIPLLSNYKFQYENIQQSKNRSKKKKKSKIKTNKNAGSGARTNASVFFIQLCREIKSKMIIKYINIQSLFIDETCKVHMIIVP